MAPTRQLPERHNPLLVEDVPPHEELVSRRRLGQTQLTARMAVGVPSAEVDASSLGWFDYAHLRAPLPKGIVSGIFKSSPPSYFLMRRSQDGYVSATGMFKATFPFADLEEEEVERKYIRSLPTTSPEETAGNVWIPPDHALVLAEEYRILPWIRALLDPSDVPAPPPVDNSPPKKILAPPKFFSAQPALAPAVPAPSRSSMRTRRSVSPMKSTAPSKRAIASPRKRRVASSQSSAVTEASQSESQAPTLVNGDIPSHVTKISPIPVPVLPISMAKTARVAKIESEDDVVKVESIDKVPAAVLHPAEEEPKIKVHVDEETKLGKDGKEIKFTKVDVEVPLLGEIPSAEDAAKMVAEAKAMVEAAAKMAEDSPAPTAKSKRKAEDIAEDESEKHDEGAVDQPQAKKAKTEVELRREKIRKRAYLGLGATFAVGAVGALLPVIGPYVMNAL